MLFHLFKLKILEPSYFKNVCVIIVGCIVQKQNVGEDMDAREEDRENVDSRTT